MGGDINKYMPAAGRYTFAWDAGHDVSEQVVSNLPRGDAGPRNNGIGASSNETDANLAQPGRYRSNGGQNGGSMWPQNSGADKGTAKAGSYPPNAWGLYDMHGNAWERCQDWYGEGESDTSLRGDDPVGPATGLGRIIKGGNAHDTASACRSARRGSGGGADCGVNTGATGIPARGTPAKRPDTG